MQMGMALSEQEDGNAEQQSKRNARGEKKKKKKEMLETNCKLDIWGGLAKRMSFLFLAEKTLTEASFLPRRGHGLGF